MLLPVHVHVGQIRPFPPNLRSLARRHSQDSSQRLRVGARGEVLPLGRGGNEVQEPVEQPGGDAVKGPAEEGGLAVGLVGESKLELAAPGGFGEEGEEVNGGGRGGGQVGEEEVGDVGPEGVPDQEGVGGRGGGTGAFVGPDLLVHVLGDVGKGSLRVGEQGVGEGRIGDEEGGDAVALGEAPRLEEGEEVVVEGVHV